MLLRINFFGLIFGPKAKPMGKGAKGYPVYLLITKKMYCNLCKISVFLIQQFHKIDWSQDSKLDLEEKGGGRP